MAFFSIRGQIIKESHDLTSILPLPDNLTFVHDYNGMSSTEKADTSGDG